MKSSRGNSSNSTSIVDKENSSSSNSNSSSVTSGSNKTTANLHPKHRTKQKYVKDQEESQVTETEEQMTLSARLESIEQKLMKLQSLKDETVDELNFLINELNEFVPILNQLNPVSSGEVTGEGESGLSKLLNRLQYLQKEYQKRRCIAEKRLNFKIDSVKERYAAEVLHNKTESKSELAETSVALIHKQMSKNQNNGVSSKSTSEESTSSVPGSSSASVVSARKRSLPAINHPVTLCPPAIKMARRQSVAAYPQNHNLISNNNQVNHNQISRETVNSSILNLNLVTTSKSVADADLLTIKSRISKALKR